MANKWIGSGTVVSDLQVNESFNQDGVANKIVHGRIAVNSRRKDADGNYISDFFNFSAFGRLAEFMLSEAPSNPGVPRVRKGTRLTYVEARLENNNYTNKEGQKVYSDELKLMEIEINYQKTDAAAVPAEDA